jgi:hypothetical protein
MPKSNYGQIAIYPDEELRKRIEAEADDRAQSRGGKRKLGPTVVEILLEYFAKKKKAA